MSDSDTRDLPTPRPIAAALSGGVDSAVAALLLQKQGYAVTGVFMRQFDLLTLDQARSSVLHCSQEEDRESAYHVARTLGIPFEAWDFREEYEEKVVKYLFRMYKRGMTPNPDIMCNRYIKFGAFLRTARKRGFDLIATGHYVIKKNDQAHETPYPHYRLCVARDQTKDQSYFLARLTHAQLKYCMFPIGELTKAQVRALAKRAGLSNWNRKDSQGICFVGKVPMVEFLKNRIPSKPGAVVDAHGKKIGTHQGAAYYTIGQRHGIGVSGKSEPYFVTRIDVKKNIITVDTVRGEELYKKEAVCSNLHWMQGSTPRESLTCFARIRYRQELQQVSVHFEKRRVRVRFRTAQRAITPGQDIVFYKKNEVLGAATIHHAK